MKIPVRRIDPAYLAEISARHGAEEVIDGAVVEVMPDSDPGVPQPAARAGGNRWLCLGIGVLAAVTGFGFIGRLEGDVPAGRAPAPSAQTAAGPSVSPAGSVQAAAAKDPFVIVSPADGATIRSSTLEVKAFASRALGTLHLAVLIGSVELGQADAEITEPGPVDTSIAVFAPPVAVQVELVVTTDAGSDVVRRALWLGGGGRLGLWPTRVLRSDGHTVLVVSGYAPLGFDRLTIRVTTWAGTPVGRGEAEVGVDAAQPGSSGGLAFGTGSFEARVSLPGSVRAGRLVLSVDWRDVATGDSGTGIQRVAIRSTGPLVRRR